MIINGNLDLERSSIESLGNIKEIKGELNLISCKKIKSLGNLKKIGKDFYSNDEIESLGDLQIVNSSVFLQKCYLLKNLGKLKKVKGSIYLLGSGITKEYIEKEKPFLLNKCVWELK